MATAKKTRRTTKKRKQPVRLLRTSERSSYKTCAWAWNRTYNIRRRPIRENPALRFGTLIHAALEVRYPVGIKRGPKPAGVFEKLYDKEFAALEAEWGPEMMRDSEGEWAEMKELGIDMLEHYVEVFGKDEEWEVLGSEMTFKVPVYSPPHKDGGYVNLIGEQIPKRVILFYYVGTMDGVWRSRMDGTVLVNDYKTTKNDPTKEAQGKYLLDEQATAYWTWGVDFLIEKGILKSRDVDNLNGMLYTFLRKAMRDDRPQDSAGMYLNQDGSVSKRQPAPWFGREIVYRSEAAREKARVRATQEVIEMERRKRGIIPIFKTPNTAQGGHCSWCGYRDICELDEEGADWDELERASMTEWDPYDAHEVREEGKR